MSDPDSCRHGLNGIKVLSLSHNTPSLTRTTPLSHTYNTPLSHIQHPSLTHATPPLSQHTQHSFFRTFNIPHAYLSLGIFLYVSFSLSISLSLYKNFHANSYHWIYTYLQSPSCPAPNSQWHTLFFHTHPFPFLIHTTASHTLYSPSSILLSINPFPVLYSP